MEQKKGFLEDGGGFLKRIRCSRYAPLWGMLIIVIMMITVVLVFSLNELNDTLQNNALLMHLQREAGLPESAGLSEAEFVDMNDISFALAWPGTVESRIDDYQTRHGSMPFSDGERSLLIEFEHRYDRFEDLVWKAWLNLPTWIGICLCLARWLIRDAQGKRFILAAVLGTGIALMPIIFVGVKLTGDFAGTLHSLLQPLFSSAPDMTQVESGLLAALFPESVLKGLAKNAAYHIGLSLTLIIVFLSAVALIVIVVDVVSKRNKRKEEREE